MHSKLTKLYSLGETWLRNVSSRSQERPEWLRRELNLDSPSASMGHRRREKRALQRLEHQENHITCSTCGTMLLIRTMLSHTPTNNDGDIIPVVATHLPQSFVAPQIHHNFIMGPQIQLVNHCTTLASPNIKINLFVSLYYVKKEPINTNEKTNLTT